MRIIIAGDFGLIHKKIQKFFDFKDFYFLATVALVTYAHMFASLRISIWKGQNSIVEDHKCNDIISVLIRRYEIGRREKKEEKKLQRNCGLCWQLEEKVDGCEWITFLAFLGVILS